MSFADAPVLIPEDLGFNYIPNFELNQEQQHNSILVKNYHI
jgi:hypothetical protein